jgi:hypothetical protein
VVGSRFLLDLEAPTSTVWLEATGTLTSTWVHVGWGDNAIFGPTDPLPVDLTQHTYCFRSQATDWVGHQEAVHPVPDVCIAILPRVYLPLIIRSFP